MFSCVVATLKMIHITFYVIYLAQKIINISFRHGGGGGGGDSRRGGVTMMVVAEVSTVVV